MMQTAMGRPIARVDGHLKVTGRAEYAADFNRPGQAYAVVVTSTVGRGQIVSVDGHVAEQLPGVLAVISHINAPRLPYLPHRVSVDPPTGERLHVLQDDRILFFGQPVAVVVAETLDAAEHAANALEIRYLAERPVVDVENPQTRIVQPQSGLQPGARIAADRSRGEADQAFQNASIRLDATYRIARQVHTPIEPHATVAEWSGDRLTLWSKSQYVANEASEIAAVFGIPRENVTVICPFVGGAFGTSLRTWPHVTLAAISAKHVNRPVKLVLVRRQMFSMTGHRPRSVQRVALAAEPDGRLKAVIHEATSETSRYEEHVEAISSVSDYVYSCPNVRTRHRVAPLDSGSPNHMRAPGEASGIVALECAVDEMASQLGMDPVEFRLRNEPTMNEAAGVPFSSRSLEACYRIAAARFGWSERKSQPRSMRDGRLLIGWGTAVATYPAFRFESRARARLLADGSAEVEVAASDMGPGTYTSMTQVAADALGLPISAVRVALGRSEFPFAPPHGGSATMASVGSAVHAACLAVRAKAEGLGAHGETFAQTITRLGGAPLEAETSSAAGEERKRFSMHSFGAVFVEVAVDPEICTVHVRRAVGCYATGRIINPRLARSQVLGGMVGGIGMALLERLVLDPRDGRQVNASMAQYLIPVNLDIGTLEALFVHEDDPYVNPLGVKGVGEIALVGMAPAIANAVFHATGRRVRDFPIRLEALLDSP
jgi:xanthine dehydrogenase YagR molybdenum-binding subunit